MTESTTGCSDRTDSTCFKDRCYACLKNNFYFLSNGSCTTNNGTLLNGVTSFSKVEECIRLSVTNTSTLASRSTLTYENTTTEINVIDIEFLPELTLCPGCSAFYHVYNRVNKNGFFEIRYDEFEYVGYPYRQIAFVAFSTMDKVYDMTYLNNVLLPPFNDDYYTIWL